MKPSKADALAALGDLIPAAALPKRADGTPKALHELIRPMWENTSMTIVMFEERCERCRAVYRQASPRILLTQTNTRRPDKTRSMAYPPGDIAIPDMLPIKYEVIQRPPIPLCVSCAPSATSFDLHRMLLLQREEEEQRARGSRADAKAAAQRRHHKAKEEPEAEWDEIDDDPASALSDLFDGEDDA